MWIFNTDGFFSVVQKPTQQKSKAVFKSGQEVTVRSRHRKELQNLIKRLGVKRGAIIKENAGTDYEFRIVLTKKLFEKYLTETVNDLNYSNFKHEISLKNKERGDKLLDVWMVLLNHTERSVDFSLNYKKSSLNR